MVKSIDQLIVSYIIPSRASGQGIKSVPSVCVSVCI